MWDASLYCNDDKIYRIILVYNSFYRAHVVTKLVSSPIKYFCKAHNSNESLYDTVLYYDQKVPLNYQAKRIK